MGKVLPEPSQREMCCFTFPLNAALLKALCGLACPRLWPLGLQSNSIQRAGFGEELAHSLQILSSAQ